MLRPPTRFAMPQPSLLTGLRDDLVPGEALPPKRPHWFYLGGMCPDLGSTYRTFRRDHAIASRDVSDSILDLGCSPLSERQLPQSGILNEVAYFDYWVLKISASKLLG